MMNCNTRIFEGSGNKAVVTALSWHLAGSTGTHNKCRSRSWLLRVCAALVSVSPSPLTSFPFLLCPFGTFMSFPLLFRIHSQFLILFQLPIVSPLPLPATLSFTLTQFKWIIPKTCHANEVDVYELCYIIFIAQITVFRSVSPCSLVDSEVELLSFIPSRWTTLFLRNFGGDLADYIVSLPRRQYSPAAGTSSPTRIDSDIRVLFEHKETYRRTLALTNYKQILE